MAPALVYLKIDRGKRKKMINKKLAGVINLAQITRYIFYGVTDKNCDVTTLSVAEIIHYFDSAGEIRQRNHFSEYLRREPLE